uniref:Short gastrulation protein n=1 Tax=Hirondellea gigas TaxID=1518452 RepID=A0A2P2I3W9_9CRUS
MRMLFSGAGHVLGWRWVLWLLVVLFIVLEMTSVGEARGDKDRRISPRREWSRRRRKNSECRLGGQRHPINSTWSPNLGPPFGVWNCVQCVCSSAKKKRRRVARVVCRNTKNQCPEVQCRNPVLLPGQCCKACPTGPVQPQLLTIPLRDEPQESNTGNDFVVLLNGRTSQSPVTSQHVATGRLSLKRSTLHFSFLLSPDMAAPAALHFLNSDGEILEDLEAQATPFAVTSNRVCGTWTRVPKQYRQLLRSEGVWVALVPPDSSEADVLSGRVAQYVGADTEVFSALLTHRRPQGKSPPESGPRLPGGGTAIVSVDSRSESLHVSLVFNGIFPSTSPHPTNTTMVLELTPSRNLPPVRDTFVLDKVYTDINKAQVMTTLGATSLPLLTRGRVHMKLWAEDAPELAIEGTVAARATCNVFSTVLTASPGQVAEGERFGAGWAVVALTDEGFFNYQVQVELPGRVTGVTLTAVYKRKERVVHDLTDSYSNGWANGTYTRPTYGDLDALMRGRLQVAVVSDTSTLDGLLEVQPMTDALRSSKPSLIRSVGVSWAATAWVAVDANCVMHYHVQLAGPGECPLWQLVLQEKDETFDPRLAQQRVVLEEAVRNCEVADHTTLLTPASLSRLHEGRVSLLEMLLFQSPNSNSVDEASATEVTLLSGRLDAMSVPTSCLLDDISRPKPGCGIECLNTDDEDRPRRTKCIDEEKRVYEDGASWTPGGLRGWSDECPHCMCTRGLITCVPEVCPDVQCSLPKRALPQHCCRMCPRNEEERRFQGPGCRFGNQTHPVGSQWHPFLPPNGFDRCVTCSCNLDDRGSSKLNCDRVHCSQLSCAREKSYLEEGSCCPVCPPNSPDPHQQSGVLSEDRRLDREHERRNRLIAEGGCPIKGIVRENGEEWHPRVSPVGEYKCIKCSCKDGISLCVRLSCPELLCPRKVHSRHACCAQCDDGSSGSGYNGVSSHRPRGGWKRNKGGKRNRKSRKNRNNDRGRRRG